LNTAGVPGSVDALEEERTGEKNRFIVLKRESLSCPIGTLPFPARGLGAAASTEFATPAGE